MFFAYILTKSRHLKFKLIRGKDSGFFKFKGFEYVIDRNAIYTKKWFGLKLVFWCMYLEGNPKPLIFDDKGYSIGLSDVPIDEIALLIRKVMKGFMDVLMVVLLIIILVVNIVLVAKVFAPVSPMS